MSVFLLLLLIIIIIIAFLLSSFCFIFSIFDILNENVSFFENRILLVILYLLI